MHKGIVLYWRNQCIPLHKIGHGNQKGNRQRNCSFAMPISTIPMKSHYYLCFLLFVIPLLSCEEEAQLILEPVQYNNAGCANCPSVSLSYPKALEDTKLGRAINTSIKEEIIGLLTFADSLDVTNLDEAVASFTSGYRELKEVYPDETVAWEATIDATISFENSKVLSIKIDSYLFTGGAHGYTATQFLNFDKDKGEEIDTQAFFEDLTAFKSFAEARFRKQEKIPETESINSTGFMFEQDSFYLPENIGLTPKGILLLYNQYEVASYADGQIEVLIPYQDAKKFVAPNIKL